MLRKSVFLMVVLLIVSLSVSIAPSVFADDTAEVKALKKDMPQDVIQVIDRTIACNRWRGEEPTGKDQIEKVNKQLATWRCDTIDADQALLAKRYQNNYDIKSRVQKAKDIF